MIRDQGYRAREGIAKTTDGDLKILSASFMDPIQLASLVSEIRRDQRLMRALRGLSCPSPSRRP